MSYRRGHLAQRASAIEASRLPEPVSREDPGRVAELAVRRSTLKEFGLTDDSGGGTIPPYHLDLPAYEVIPQTVKDDWGRVSAGWALGPDGKYVSSPSGQPRLSYQNGDPALLVEAGQRTNYLPNSSDASAWSTVDSPSFSSSLPSIIDGQSAYSCEGGKLITTSSASYSEVTETLYVIIEKDTAESTQILVRQGSGGSIVARAKYDWSTDTFSNSYLATPYREIETENGPNEGRVVRFAIKYDASSANSLTEKSLELRPDGNTNGKATIVHHAQLEEAPNGSAPIVTGGGEVTRGRDDYFFKIGSRYSADEGTFLLSITQNVIERGKVFYPFSQKGGTKPGLVMAGGFKIWDPSGNETKYLGSPTPFSENQVAFSFTNSEMRLSAGGVSDASNHDGSFLEDDRFIPGIWLNDSIVTFGKIIYVPYALPESMLNKITR